MTALAKYQRLECTGLWRESPEAQRREVVVGFREATLVLSDPRSEAALTHWSLPAVVRLNAGALPAEFGPGPDAPETLEIEDFDMIAALEKVHSALTARQPKPGRLRGAILGGSLLAVMALGVFWLPGALIAHTASVLPAATRTAIGQAALEDVVRLTGAPCATPLGTRALAQLADRVFGPGPPRIVILPEGLQVTANLPGPVILIPRAAVDEADGPQVAAGLVLAETLRSEATDPMVPLLRHAGVTATFRLLTTGTLPDGAVSGYGEVLLQSPPAILSDTALLARFGSAEVPSSPYAYAMDPTGETTLGLIEADPFPTGPARPLLSDEHWVSLQAICS